MTCSSSVRATVIGTGFGGAVAACRLSQAGFAPLVLERGRRYEQDDFPGLPPNDGFLPDTRRLAWGPNQGLVDVQDLDEIVSVQVAGYGGGSLLYGNVHLRPPGEIFDQVEHCGGKDRLWPDWYTRANLDEFYDLVASMLDAAPITEHTDGRGLVKADQLRRAASALHRDEGFFHPPLTISRRNGANAHHKQQGACIQCGACCMGCPQRAKNTLDYNYLAIAEEHGARVRTQCEVLEIEREGRRYRVHYVDHLTASRECVETQFLFLCAGTVHTTRLLAAAKLNLGDDERERKLKARIGLGYWPNADAIGVVFDTKHPQHPSWGPAITAATVFQDRSGGDPARGWFMIQDGGYARELERAIGLFRSPVWAGRNRFREPADVRVVDASAPGPQAREPQTGAPPLPSPLDAILDAWASGVLDSAVPEQLANVKDAIRKDLAGLFLPAIVGDTIDRALRVRMERILRWLGGPNSLPSRALLAILKRLAGALGTPAQIALSAHDSLVRLGGLSRTEIATRLLGYGDERPEHRTMLLAMGPDSTPGVLRYLDGRLSADLDLYHLAPRYLDEELAMRDIAAALGGELRVNPAWAFLGKPITVHGQGGCRLSQTPDRGVVDPDGQVWDCPGLYVLDGASLCSSVGANPSATIAAIAERNILEFIKRQPGNENWPDSEQSPGAAQYREQCAEAVRWKARATEQNWTIEPPRAKAVEYRSKPIGLAFDERMQGFHADLAAGGARARQFRADVLNEVDAAYRLLEGLGRPSYPIQVWLTPHVEDLTRFFEDKMHRMEVTGRVWARLPGDDASDDFKVKEGSFLSLFRAHRKKRALVDGDTIRAQEGIAGSYTSQWNEHGRERLMYYYLLFDDRRGTAWRLEGYKRIKDDPGLDAWRDTTTLFVRLFAAGELRSAGIVHIDLPGLQAQLRSMRIMYGGKRIVSGRIEAMPDPDPARVAWALASFGQFFFGNLQRIYPEALGSALDSLLRSPGGSSH
jgi:choline dehydrogenase-like flavoprotein